ncbi:MAG: hypothetical protein WDN28_20645 [Chthoniobacter sp.]
MKSHTMKGVGVVPKDKELRVIDHPEPSIAAPNEIKIRTLEVGVCGTDREICTFAYGQPPGGRGLPAARPRMPRRSDRGRLRGAEIPARRSRGAQRAPPLQRSGLPPCREGRQDFCVTWNFTERGINQRHGFMTERFVEETSISPRCRRICAIWP